MVLAGMAGYGKSTLLSAAAHRMPFDGATVWLTLDDVDKDPVHLVGDLLEATGRAGIDAVSEPLQHLRDASLRAEPLALVDSLLEVLYDSAGPILLALDDVQHLSGSPAATAIIDHLLRWVPANLRVVLAARVVPPLRLQRLRLEDRLTYLSHDELAFTPEESLAAVRAGGLDSDRGTVNAIHEATGGWPAGVRMAILASRHNSAPGELSLQLRRDHALADYLATEVLAALPTNLRDFVLDSCLDEQVCPSLVDTIRGTTTAESMLEQCLAAGLFLSRGDITAQGQWYHWHQLFAAHIRRRLATEHPDRAARLHAASATWWTPIDVPVAVGHALAAGDGETASAIFADGWLELYLKGRVDAVLSAVARLPHVSAHCSDAHLAKALTLVHEDRLGEARAELDSARVTAELLPESERGRLAERTALVELFVIGGDLGLAVAAGSGSTLLDTLDALNTEATGADPVVRASVQVFVGMAEARLRMSRDSPLELLRAAARTAEGKGLTALELTALAETCIPAIEEGRLTEVHDLAVDVLARADARGWVGLVTLAPAVGFLGWLDHWRGNLRESRTQLERSLSMALPFDRELRGLILNFHAHSCLSLGDLRAARTSAAEIATLMASGPTPSWWRSMLDGLEGLILCSEGRADDAVALALSVPTGTQYSLAGAHRATVLLRARRPTEALAELERAADSCALVHVDTLSRCIEAEALAALGEEDAHLALERALAAAEPDELWGPFLAAGQGLRDLLKLHLRHGTSHPSAVTQLLGRISEAQQPHASAWGEQLTDRERVILRYLATNLTNTEIADAEFISVHTAKTHIAHIYRKLGVSNRRSAIRRAAELDLY
ncbi:LuxR C-terminal-related transcriptional regulator [Humibacillus xanthopallidus]|uniref:LuxR C-terminal-related transcriptional regulator n=1 Tax=Humibacillus xanthopallidus TaxID=412689 RepID=UPI00384F8A1E